MTNGGEQLGLALGPYSDRRLFSEHYLEEVLPGLEGFIGLELGDVPSRLDDLWRSEQSSLPNSNEAQTEERFIKPVLVALGFQWTVQAGVPFHSGRRQPDYALFADEAARAAGDALEGRARYGTAVAVADAKRFDRPLDTRVREEGVSEDPVAQIIHYIQITKRPWGILTNGRLWRLYAAEGDLVEGACLEIDLVSLIETGDPEKLRPFLAFFGRQAFEKGADGLCFLDRALTESRSRAVAVGDQLERQVFAAVPMIAQGLLGADERTEEALGAGFDNALVLLYRLLFCLHGEARGLLPVGNPHYDRYSVRSQALALATDRDAGRVFSERSDDLYNDLRGLFRIVDGGDTALGVNEYNGGLFSASAHPYFEGRFVPDSLLAPALDRLYRVHGEMVDYRDLSIRHLGTIYERLLAFRLQEVEGILVLVEDPVARKLTGSYFTPEEVVDVIVQRTLDPVLERKSGEVAQAGLSGAEALDALLGLRVVDPAMGSAHFLVSVVAYVALAVANDPSFDVDLDLGELQRLVAERCVYGVDLNPMAVELARLALWLATVKGDEPLTFLRNLRVGNSLVGADVEGLIEGGETVFAHALGGDAKRLLAGAADLEAQASSTATQVRGKDRLERELAQARGALQQLADTALDGGFEGSGRLFHWELEFPEVFLDAAGRPDPSGGFDAVVGNPPYIRIQDLGRGLATWCRRTYKTASGSFDVYLPFIERGIGLLGPNGRLGFIAPNKWLKLEFASRLREWFAEAGLVDEVIDFGDAQVFGGATNYTCILLVDRRGARQLHYRRVPASGHTVGEAMDVAEATEPEEYEPGDFGADPWVLAVGEDAEVLRVADEGSQRLGDVTRQIFQGLITGADPIFIVTDRGRRGDKRIVHSSASGRELELESELLKPLASGVDVDPYAFRPLGDLLLFPYVRDGDVMRLATEQQLGRLPATWEYLREHESTLRGRERGRMNRDGWWQFGRNQNLGAHDSAKLGVAATVQHLEVAADPGGGIHFHNVRVNGILLADDGPSLWTLLALLNSRLLDFYFRRLSVAHANGYFAANKQFIAPLPIHSDAPQAQLDPLGELLHNRAAAISRERQELLDWLGGQLGTDPAGLPGSTVLTAYERHTLNELIAVLERSAGALRVEPGSRTFREQLATELEASLDRLSPLQADLRSGIAEADDLVFNLYGLPAALRTVVDREYDR